VLTTAYMLIAIWFEERDLLAAHGEDYRRYRESVPMLIPRPGKAAAPTAEPVPA
jgi:protein-S-isoprenylcysteine O-methyltransferase Ste14